MSAPIKEFTGYFNEIQKTYEQDLLHPAYDMDFRRHHKMFGVLILDSSNSDTLKIHMPYIYKEQKGHIPLLAFEACKHIAQYIQMHRENFLQNKIEFLASNTIAKLTQAIGFEAEPVSNLAKSDEKNLRIYYEKTGAYKRGNPLKPYVVSQTVDDFLRFWLRDDAAIKAEIKEKFRSAGSEKAPSVLSQRV